MTQRPLRLAVIGGADCDEDHARLARETGAAIGQAGAILVCGGREGVMAAAAEGARSTGAQTVGILPGASPLETPPNPHIDLPIFTGLGQARNQVLVLSADAVIGIGGGWGTLSEIGLALKYRIPVVLLSSWRLTRPDADPEPLLMQAATADEALQLAQTLVQSKGAR